ncbi:endonuclease/exonuclease/phosphatase family protein [Verrucomicrobiaceae bacterium 5K15]|uniref:Endonuclease/exonuclease/phosphatase family protein n=1 Tax=Oceaniferula flava TaxID=2800421 RepID=A0AAE2VDT7_9BACT|nr:endonuclease/exonuclease/phosphatase family protein [Oceaniferula flavus]MBK1854999.1 endonuclease/exonuclease/phosphatase family protein [Oceaniferula flavus]MBM1136305.1 endonuclease/exonuclease/phosphatase family protein [Oceaniferula flavus]
MRILSWNLQHGGGSRIERLSKALVSYDADVILLNEYRHNKAGADLRARLTEAGYAYQSEPHAEPRQNIIFAASRQPFEATTFPGQLSDPELGDYTARVLLVRIGDLNIFGVYMPSMKFKRPVFDFLLRLSERYLTEDSLIMGDLNTGRHYEDEAGATFVSTSQFEALLAQGWIDTWRSRNPEAREFTWFSRGYNNGFRLDHALASPSLDKKVEDAFYSHKEREDGVTDHSLMILDIKSPIY